MDQIQNIENASKDVQKLFLAKLNPPDIQNLFIASKKLKNTLDTEEFWLKKTKQYNQKQYLSAKQKCLLEYERFTKIEKAKKKLFVAIKAFLENEDEQTVIDTPNDIALNTYEYREVPNTMDMNRILKYRVIIELSKTLRLITRFDRLFIHDFSLDSFIIVDNDHSNQCDPAKILINKNKMILVTGQSSLLSVTGKIYKINQKDGFIAQVFEKLDQKIF